MDEDAAAHRSHLWRRVLIAYAMLAVVVLAAVGAWFATRDGPPAFEAEQLAVNEKGALYRVTASEGAGGDPLRWSDLHSSFPMEPLGDVDGYASPQEPFFVFSAEPERVHVVTISVQDRLVWTGAFTSLEQGRDPVVVDVEDPPKDMGDIWGEIERLRPPTLG